VSPSRSTVLLRRAVKRKRPQRTADDIAYDLRRRAGFPVKQKPQDWDALIRTVHNWNDSLTKKQPSSMPSPLEIPRLRASYCDFSDAFTVFLQKFGFNVFATLTFRGTNPAPEKIEKAIRAFLWKLQTKYFGVPGVATNVIVYAAGLERGTCPCGDKRWHCHLLFKIPGYDNGENFKRWNAEWNALHGYARFETPRSERALRYMSSYAVKNGDVLIRSTYDDFLEHRSRNTSSNFRGEPFASEQACTFCGLLSGCSCHAVPKPPTPTWALGGVASEEEQKTIHVESAPSFARSRRDRRTFLRSTLRYEFREELERYKGLSPWRARRAARVLPHGRDLLKYLRRVRSRHGPKQMRLTLECSAQRASGVAA